METLTAYFIISIIMWIGLIIHNRKTKKQITAVKYQLDKKEALLKEMQLTFANYIDNNGGIFVFVTKETDALDFELNGSAYSLEPSEWWINGTMVPFNIFHGRFITDCANAVWKK